MKTKTIFFILFGIWMVDIFITFIALNYFGMIEVNPRLNYFFSFGILGWIFAILIVADVLAIFSYSLEKAHDWFLNKYDSKRLAILIPISGVSVWVILMSWTIIHNLRLIL